MILVHLLDNVSTYKVKEIQNFNQDSLWRDHSLWREKENRFAAMLLLQNSMDLIEKVHATRFERSETDLITAVRPITNGFNGYEHSRIF